MESEPQFTRRILREFQEVLSKNLNFAWKPEHGTPPVIAYVAQTSNHQQWWSNDSIVAAWKVTPDSVEGMAISEFLKIKPAKLINGMFFDICLGSFQIDEASAFVWTNWQTGPRFGRGFRHTIEKNSEDVKYLGRPTLVWAS